MTMALYGGDLFAASPDYDSVTELNTSTGTPVRVISGLSYGFNGSDGTALKVMTCS